MNSGHSKPTLESSVGSGLEKIETCPYLCAAGQNGDLSFVHARSKEEAIIALDEWDNVELAEMMPVSEFMVDFRLNADGELVLQDFGEALRDRRHKRTWTKPLARRTASGRAPSTLTSCRCCFGPLFPPSRQYESTKTAN